MNNKEKFWTVVLFLLQNPCEPSCILIPIMLTLIVGIVLNKFLQFTRKLTKVAIFAYVLHYDMILQFATSSIDLEFLFYLLVLCCD